jgi:drug/metabolite transporter (DMT)-like permease
MKEEDSDPFAQTIAFYGIVGLFALIFSLFRGGFHYQVSYDQIPLFIVITIFSAATSVLGFKALKLIEASEYIILFSSSRLWVVFGAFIYLHEYFSLPKVIGTSIILLGIAFAEWRNHKLVVNIGVLLTLVAAFCFATTELVSFFILRNFDANSFTVYTYLLPIVALLLININSLKKLAFYARPKNAINIVAVSIGDFVATLFLFYAYQVGRNASQIGPIMALQTILSVFLAIIFLKERGFVINKIVGATLVVAGILFVL